MWAEGEKHTHTHTDKFSFKLWVRDHTNSWDPVKPSSSSFIVFTQTIVKQCIFFKQYWHIVGEDVYNLVHQAFETCTFNSVIAETLIALIPKVDCPQNFKEFRPISLYNTIYKLITKVLVNRLRPYLDEIVGPYQSSFLPGRGTSNNAIILQEVIHSMRKSKKKKGDVVYKIDLEKTYDHVNWGFLRSCLQQFGFPLMTIHLIMHCVTVSNLSIIWNGKRLPSFAPNRGPFHHISLLSVWSFYPILFWRLLIATFGSQWPLLGMVQLCLTCFL